MDKNKLIKNKSFAKKLSVEYTYIMLVYKYMLVYIFIKVNTTRLIFFFFFAKYASICVGVKHCKGMNMWQLAVKRSILNIQVMISNYNY